MMKDMFVMNSLSEKESGVPDDQILKNIGGYHGSFKEN